MREKLTRVLTAVVAAVAVLAQGGAVSAETSTVDQEMKKLLAFYQGSQPVGSEGVLIAPGIEVLIPLEIRRASPPATVNPCPAGKLCIYENEVYGGYGLALSTCDEVYLEALQHPSGSYWLDQASSFINNEAAGTRAVFYNYTGPTKMAWFISVAPNSMNWMNAAGNDHIDHIKAC